MACTVTIGATLDGNMSGGNGRTAANANGADMNGGSMSAGNGAVGVTGMTGDINSARDSGRPLPWCVRDDLFLPQSEHRVNRCSSMRG